MEKRGYASNETPFGVVHLPADAVDSSPSMKSAVLDAHIALLNKSTAPGDEQAIDTAAHVLKAARPKGKN